MKTWFRTVSQKNGKFALRAYSTFYAALVMNDHQQVPKDAIEHKSHSWWWCSWFSSQNLLFRGGSQRPFGNFLKIHPFWRRSASLSSWRFWKWKFLGKCTSCQCSLSQSLIVCRAVNITLLFFGVLSCVFWSLRFFVGCLPVGKDFVDVTLV